MKEIIIQTTLIIEKLILSAFAGLGYIFISALLNNNVIISIFVGILVGIVNMNFTMNKVQEETKK
jgi:hypothetical protein